MSFSALPPELRSLCQRLASTKVEHLPNILPHLVQDVLKCQGPLSAPEDSRSSSHASEAALLLHKLRTALTTLLNGRTVEGRFVAVVLIKAVIEAGGWECLRIAEPWVRGLLSILQKRDPLVTKELCVVSLTKIYTLLHRYHTLIREIASPTLPAFATACLQMLKPTAMRLTVKVPMSLFETVFEAFSSLIPLYPTTLRPFVHQIRTAAKPYLAPTMSDGFLVPDALQASSRRLVVRLHMTAAKGAGADEWTKQVTELVREAHATADQVFRAVPESWESTCGYTRQQVDFDTEASGGGTAAELLPPWTGIQAGTERMVGLLAYLAEYLRCKSKSPLLVPLSPITDLTTRLSSIMLPAPGKVDHSSMQLDSAVRKEEKDELWTALSDVQCAAMKLVLALSQRLGRNYIPLAPDTLAQTIRMMASGYRFPSFRAVSFRLVNEMLGLCGPTSTKTDIDALALIARSCCRDLLGDAGQVKATSHKVASAQQNGLEAKTVSRNADSFLSSKVEEDHLSVTLEAEHRSAAEALLVTLLSHVRQDLVNASLRSQMLSAAILCRNKNAQLASVIHPSRDKSGKMAQVILPYLHRQFPHDPAVEALRFNFRPLATGPRETVLDADGYMGTEEPPTSEGPANGSTFDRAFEPSVRGPKQGILSTNTPAQPVLEPTRSETAGLQSNPFPVRHSPARTVQETVHASVNPLKRKGNDDAGINASKRVETAAAKPSTTVASDFVSDHTGSTTGLGINARAADEEESDDESVHLNMELDPDSEEESPGLEMTARAADEEASDDESVHPNMEFDLDSSDDERL